MPRLISRAVSFVMGAIPFLIGAFLIAFISWSFDVWLSPKILDPTEQNPTTGLKHISHHLTNAECLNVAGWIVIAIGALTYSLTMFGRSRDSANEGILFSSYALGIFFVLAFVAYLCTFVWNEAGMGPFATLAGASLATMGWLTSAFLAVRNHQLASKAGATAGRKQHTLNILLQMRQSAEFSKYRQTIYSKFPVGRKLTEGDVVAIMGEFREEYDYSPAAAPRIGEFVRYVTNYYEFLCVALEEQDLDETLLKKSLKEIMQRYEEKVRLFIDEAQRQDPLAFKCFRAVVRRWSLEPN